MFSLRHLLKNKKNSMVILFFFLAFFISFGKLFAQKAPNLNEKVNAFTLYQTPQGFPDSAVFYDKDGKKIPLSSLHGQVIVLNFWKATCKKCLIEMPSLNRLQKKFPNIRVIAVSQGDEDADFIEKTLHHERRLPLIDVALDKNQLLFKLMNGDKVPQTRLIGQDGQVIGFIKGEADFDSLSLHEQIQNLIETGETDE